MKKKISAGVVALIAAIALMAVGGIGTARAALNVQSEDFTGWFYMDHLQVHLLENGVDVCSGHNTLEGESKEKGELLSIQHESPIDYVGDTKGEVIKYGGIEPGRVYREEIAGQNGSDIDIYLRMTVRKYWVNTETKDKVTDLLPSRIHLAYNGEEYNTGAWQINDLETTTESCTYYYTNVLGAGAVTEPLFNEFWIDGELAKAVSVEEYQEGNKIYRTTTYLYDGYACYIEADVQAIQTHNAEDAIHSQWGMYNISTEGSGAPLSVQ